MPRVTIPPSGGSGTARVITPLAINVSGFEHTQTVVEASCSPSSKVLMYADSSSDLDHNDMSGIQWQYSVTPLAGSFEIEIGFTQKQFGQLNLLYEVV